MINYIGSKLADQAHGFGRFETDDEIYIGWFEYGKPSGFGTTFYKNLNQIDIGFWENDTLLKFSSGKPLLAVYTVHISL